MIHFTILGIPVRVEPWFWLTMALIGESFRTADGSTGIMHTVAFVFAGFLSILIHELGHALTIRKYGLPTSITLQAFGGYAAYPAGRLSRKQSFWVTFAGPAVQLTLGVLLIFLARAISIPDGSLFEPFLVYLISVSIFWAIFNCFPIYPMDGGHMLGALLGPQRQKIVHIIGIICSIALALAGYFMLQSFFLPIFMGLFAYQNWQALQATSSQ
jgi:Zn-dependent protease